MLFETYTPDKIIASDIEAIFHYEGFKPDHSIERVVPTGHIFILFELDGYVRNTYNNQTLQPIAEYSKVWLSGAHRDHISISVHDDSQMLVVQFKPYGSHPFTHVSTETLNERVMPVQEVMGEGLLHLRDEMMETQNTDDKFSLIEQWLLDRFDQSRQAPVELREFIAELQAQPIIKLHDLVESYSSTQKNLISQFRKYVGLTPKAYQRILRFNDLLLKIKQQETFSWAEVAYECGYSDQSHFIREFQNFSGMNPDEFAKLGLNLLEPNFFPLDRA